MATKIKNGRRKPDSAVSGNGTGSFQETGPIEEMQLRQVQMVQLEFSFMKDMPLVASPGSVLELQLLVEAAVGAAMKKAHLCGVRFK